MKQVGAYKLYSFVRYCQAVLKYWSMNVHKAPYMVEDTGALDPDT